MDYEEFLHERRFAMAQVTQEAFRRLSDPHYKPRSGPAALAAPGQDTVTTSSLSELVAAGLLKPGDFLIPADPERDDTIAEITVDALISLDDRVYDSPRRAARADGDERSDGWDYWVLLDDADPLRTLRELANSMA